MTDQSPPGIPALQIRHTTEEVWRVAAKWSDGRVEDIADSACNNFALAGDAVLATIDEPLNLG